MQRSPAPHRRRRAGALVALLAVLGGCGTASEVTLPGPQSSTPPLTRIEYTTRANEICRATTRAIAERTTEIGTAHLEAGSGGDRQMLADEILPIARLALSRLRNLTPPPEDAALAGRGIDAMQAALDAAGTDPTAPLDPVGLAMPEQYDYGLTGCFSHGRPSPP